MERDNVEGHDGWHNALKNLCEILGMFASPEWAEKLGLGLTDPIDSDELLEMFHDFYDIVGPETENRIRTLPTDLDARLRRFANSANAAIRTEPPDPTSETYPGARFLRLYGRLRSGQAPLPEDMLPPKMVSDAELVKSAAWKRLQIDAAALILDLRDLY